MKHFKTLSFPTLSLLVATGCGAADEIGAVDGTEPRDTSATAAEAAAGAELARIEFADGNVVRFEELNGGVLVMEIGSELNPRRVSAKSGMTALAAFQSLAPGRTVPAALERAHERMYPAGATLATTPEADTAAEGLQDLELDADLEHNGEFQQSYPAANFLRVMCDFPLTNAYKHQNRTDAHTDVSMNVNTAYYAIGSDIGTITAKACAGKNAGGYFDGKCSAALPIQAGYHTSGYYDAGLSCSKSWGVEICFPKEVRFELQYNKISSSVRFHECAKLGRVR